MLGYLGDEEVEVEAFDEHPAEGAHEEEVHEDGDGEAQVGVVGGVEAGEQEDLGDEQVEAQVAVDVRAEVAAQRAHRVEDDEREHEERYGDALAHPRDVIQRQSLLYFHQSNKNIQQVALK